MLAINRQRILRNTSMLYMRMFFVIVINLYISRVVLAEIGLEDFGIYHVIAGFVSLLGFLHGAITTATQRYFSFDLGESGGNNLNRIFNSSLLIHILLALLIILVAETVGYWFVETKLTIPADRMEAALWAYHFTVATFAVSIITAPFTAMQIAQERMGIFAVIGILDVLLKLTAVFLMHYLSSDILIAYASLLLLVSLAIMLLNIVINKFMFPQIKLGLKWRSLQFHHMLSHTIWNIWGNLSAAFSGEGSNVLLNIFFGPVVSASKSISAQANGALNNFVINVQTSINPQIIKLYAIGEYARMHIIVLHAAKYNFFLLFTLSLPILLYTESLLNLWLVEVPNYAVIFLQITIVTSLIDSFSGPLMTSAQATGQIKLYQSVVGGLLLLNAPLSFYFLYIGYPPEAVLFTSLALSFFAFILRLLIVCPLIKLPKKIFVSTVLVRALLVALTAGFFAKLLLLNTANSALALIVGIALTILLTSTIIWLMGLNKAERRVIIQFIKTLKINIQ